MICVLNAILFFSLGRLLRHWKPNRASPMKPRMSEHSDVLFFRETGTPLRNLWNRSKFVMGTIYEYVDLFSLTELQPLNHPS
jgi:hypothetical protein